MIDSIKRYIPGTDPLDVELYRYTTAERDELVARVQAATTPKRLAASRATTARWEQYRASRPSERPTAASLRGQRMHVTNPGRVAARYAMLVGCTLATAVWTMRDVGAWVSPKTVSKRWREIYPDVPVGVQQRVVAAQRAVTTSPTGPVRK